MIHGAAGHYLFDVDKAQAITSDGRRPKLIPADLLERLLEVNNDWHPKHVGHVDGRLPGIMGLHFGALALLDGTHRAVRALKANQNFFAFMLDAWETHECLINQPAMGPGEIVSEIRGVLSKNPQIAVLEIELELNEGENQAEKEASIRHYLEHSENSRLVFVFHNVKPEEK
jgi:hypothetical protein